MVSMEESDVVAVSRAREGDGDAFRMLVDRHSRAIFRVAYRMLGSQQDAEDVVQETFLRAFRKLKGFEDRAHFSTWLYRIAVNCSLDWMRKHRKHNEFNDSVEQECEVSYPAQREGVSTPEQMIFRIEVQKRVKSALQDLSPQERSAFILRHYEGMSIEEIAEALGMRSNAAKHSIFRAVRKMRRALAPIVSFAE
jgi:RNA polymerase sigma-70 factor (ECF subfamily)